MKKTVWLLSVFLLFISGCQAPETKKPEASAVQFAHQFLGELWRGDMEAVAGKINEPYRSERLLKQLAKSRERFSPEAPIKHRLLGYQMLEQDGVESLTLSFQSQVGEMVVLASVNLQPVGDSYLVNGVHVKSLPKTLEEINAFTFSGKSVLHYLFFLMMIAIPAFIVFVLVLCLRTPGLKFKWLWFVFIAFSIGSVTINWTGGGVALFPLSFYLLGASFARLGEAGPWFISVGVPVGAVLFLALRKRLAQG